MTRCYITGIYSNGTGPALGSAIRKCSFSSIGGSTTAANVSTAAIYTFGGGFRIQNNSVSGVQATGTGESYGIRSDIPDFVIGNTVANCDVGISRSKCLNNLTYNVPLPFKNINAAVGND